MQPSSAGTQNSTVGIFGTRISRAASSRGSRRTLASTAIPRGHRMSARWRSAQSRLGRPALFLKDLVSGTEEPLVAFDEPLVLDQWTPDGRFVIARTFGKAVYAVPLDGDRKPRLLVDTPYHRDELRVSPDGRWVAFNADESGRWEVYVAEFPAFTSKRQISEAGGVQPQWRADGRELFYLASDGSMMSARVDTRSGLTVSPPSRLVLDEARDEPQRGPVRRHR